MTLHGRHVHFVGIGGVSMSAIAHLALERGGLVSGCDLQDSPRTEALAEEGCAIHVGHDPAHLDGVELVVRSSAVPEDAPEIEAALRRHIPVISRARMLARLAGDDRVIAVAGSHGKTTTTWMAARLLIEARCDPSAMVGGRVAELGGSYRVGDGRYFVIEADESDGTLLEFQPHCTIVTNLDLEHVDRYPDLEALQAVFRRFLARTRPDGCVILCADDEPTMAVRDAWDGAYLTYGFAGEADVRGENLRLHPQSATLDVRRPGGVLPNLRVNLPGRHNAENALAVAALASALGLPDDALRAALAHIEGVGRRLERTGRAAGVTVLDDYAHHPTEIRATLDAARHVAEGRLIGVFQPHRYTRTLHLARAFAECFDSLDHLVVVPLYAAGEPPIEGVTAQRIVEAVVEGGAVEVAWFEDWDGARRHLLDLLRAGDTLLTLGAGDVYQLGEQVLDELRKRDDAL
ncbi:MAG: UDP-N-acetylmuramate--L-alanine ligase [bacterium]